MLKSAAHLGPITAVRCYHQELFFGCGPTICRSDGSTYLRLHGGETIHQIDVYEELLAVSSSFSVHIANSEGILSSFSGSEFVLCLKWLDERSLIVVRSRGLVQLIEKDGDLWQCSRISQTDERGVIWSAAVHVSEFATVAMGTSFGEVLLCRPEFEIEAEAYAVRYSGHRGPIFGLEFAEHGRLLASCGDDRTVRVWKRSSNADLEGLVQLHSFWGHSARVWNVVFSDVENDNNSNEDQFLILSCAEDRSFHAWDKDGLIAVKRGHEGKNVRSIAVQGGEDGVKVITGGDDAALKSCPLPNRSIDRPFALPLAFPAEDRGGGNREAVRGVQLIGGERAVVSTDFGRIFTVCFSERIPKWKLRHASKTLRYSPNSLAVSRAMNLIAAGATSGETALFNLNSVESNMVDIADHLWTIGPAFRGLVMGIYFDNERNSVYLADPHGSLHHFKRITSEGKESHWSRCRVLTSKFGAIVTTVVCLEDSLFCGDRKGNVMSFRREFSEKENGQQSLTEPEPESALIEVKCHKDRAVDIVSAPDNQTIITGGADGSIAAVDVRNGDVLWRTKTHEGVNCLDRLFVVNEDIVASGFRSVNFYIWNLSARLELTSVECGGWRRPHDFLAVNDDPNEGGSFVYWKADDLFLYSFKFQEGVPKNLIPGRGFHGNRANACCFISSKRAVSFSEDTTGRVFSVDIDKMTICSRQTLVSHISGVHAVAFDQGKSLLFSGGGKNELLCWSVGTDGVISLKATTRIKGVKYNTKAAARVTSAIAMDAGFMVVGRSDSSVCTATLRESRIVQFVADGGRHHGAVKAIATVDGEYVVTGDTSGLVCVWHCPAFGELNFLYQFQAHALGTNGVDVLTIGKESILATCGDDQSIAFWKWTKEGMFLLQRVEEAHTAAVTDMKAVQESECFLSVGADRKLIVWSHSEAEEDHLRTFSAKRTVRTSVNDPACVAVRGDVVLVAGFGIEALKIS
ncbi:hypothetical protein NDN08_002855 [Rhodosorus marinus]|uniref:HELP domain-containing protein n=1 Tax=Rhodosorus marinus TaxID=101924 RepID=A0AAV8UYE1_9RHOD|nr:hypothetical protein NDN08_002855 [Rhodosorus marinus]